MILAENETTDKDLKSRKIGFPAKMILREVAPRHKNPQLSLSKNIFENQVPWTPKLTIRRAFSLRK